MPHDLALAHRRTWLKTLARDRHMTWHRDLTDRLADWVVPARRRARQQVRETLVRL